jgi:Flp pilus assembly protein TadD
MPWKKNGGTPGDSVKPEEKAELTRENKALRSRIEAYEARPAPFTPEELALFKKPEEASQAKSFVVASKMTKELPSKVKAMVAEADRAFASQRFEEAAKKYAQVLEQNENNVYTLANLASAQIELNRLEEAEQNLKRALALDANDAFSLLLFGKLKMSQGNFDEALDALSHSAQLNPNSAETQNYLGIALSEKGQRVPAEAALRKAIQIQPDYASAHHNLAIIYATQKPPFLELARWHYDKAVALGHSKNGDLEKMIAGK